MTERDFAKLNLHLNLFEQPAGNDLFNSFPKHWGSILHSLLADYYMKI